MYQNYFFFESEKNAMEKQMDVIEGYHMLLANHVDWQPTWNSKSLRKQYRDWEESIAFETVSNRMLYFWRLPPEEIVRQWRYIFVRVINR